MRDCYHTRMPSFQVDYILLNAVITKNKTLGFKRKAFIDIQNMFNTRTRLHSLIYQHKTSLKYDTVFMCMITKISDEILFDNNLCDYKLESILMSHEKTKDIYYQMECINIDHSILCCDNKHPICIKKIEESGTIEQIEWID